jgi:hypothetical protein
MLEQALAPRCGTQSPIPVRRFLWTSENHHLGRAHAAIQLIDELLARAPTASGGGRVLIWAHSHGGNVCALASNLLAADDKALAAFFAAASVFCRSPRGENRVALVWRRVHDALRSGRLGDRWRLDVVTFGAPIRYGWDMGGCERLLHIVNHRPAPGLEEYRAPFPPHPAAVLRAVHGDYVQQFGIAGTDLAPPPWAMRSWLANRRLGRLVQASVRQRDLGNNLRHGMRVASDGTTLLVDYGDAGDSLPDHLAGHGVYTRSLWLPFHTIEVCRRLYGMSPDC